MSILAFARIGYGISAAVVVVAVVLACIAATQQEVTTLFIVAGGIALYGFAIVFYPDSFAAIDRAFLALSWRGTERLEPRLILTRLSGLVIVAMAGFLIFMGLKLDAM
jgi:hypothetical protein